MTVNELITELLRLPSDAEVYIDCDEYQQPVVSVEHFPNAVGIKYTGGYTEIVTDKTVDQIVDDQTMYNPLGNTDNMREINLVMVNRCDR